MKAIIIDDEVLARQNVADALSKHPEIMLAGEFRDGFEGIKAIQELQPDLVFLDIQMPRLNGFEMLELLDKPPAVVFITAFDEFAMKAFELSAVDYLLKPFSQERFDNAISKAIRLRQAEPEKLLALQEQANHSTARIALRHQGEIRIVPTENIIYIEAWDDYVKIHTANETYVKKQTLTKLETGLQKSGFIRCHRSYLVNSTQIQAINAGESDQWEIRLKNGFHIPVSRQGYQRVKEQLGI
jgi:two-component system LytT family response regulator